MQKNISFTKLKGKIIFKKGKNGRRKKNVTELQKPNIEAEVYNNNKKCD